MSSTTHSAATRRRPSSPRPSTESRHSSPPAAPAPPVPIGRARRLYAALKPCGDAVLAFAGLCLLSPVLLALAAAVRLDSRGPIFYRQRRVGRNRRRADGGYTGLERRGRDVGGEPFTLLKFRTMVPDAEAATGPVWAVVDQDPRTTRVGKVLRATHLDELPQLFSVVTGDMGIIGPRPERPEFVPGLAMRVDGYRLRHTMRPGITGLAQVRHKADESLQDVQRKVRYDLHYIRRQSLALDLQILFATAQKCWRALRRHLRPAPNRTK